MRRTLSVLKQPLETLGLNPAVRYSENEIRDAFRARAMTLHPDVGGDPEHFKELRHAYESLTGQFGKAEDPGVGSSRPGPNSNPKQRYPTRVSRLRLHVFYEYRSHAILSPIRNRGIFFRSCENFRRAVRRYLYELPLSRMSTRGLYLLRRFNFHHPMGRALAEDDVTAANRLTRLAISWCIVRYRLLWICVAYFVVCYVLYQEPEGSSTSKPTLRQN
ncbi:unnamed protein product [Phytomonas sp. EM1]|nr:unnamed protein product [Phytomonas sp. EM1]|eukprot:CCW65220.1 unnamed protein product [Phytomonas sp. isolate EM1]